MTLRTGSKGFTLIEIMVAASVLTLGTLVVGEGMLRSARVLDHYTSLLKVERWASERLWDAQYSLHYAETPSGANGAGQFTDAGRQYEWSLAVVPVDGASALYILDLTVRWNEGNRPVEFQRMHYAVP